MLMSFECFAEASLVIERKNHKKSRLQVFKVKFVKIVLVFLVARCNHCPLPSLCTSKKNLSESSP